MIFITESWLRYDFPDSLVLSKTSYSLFRKDRLDGYGGVAVFVSNLLKVVSIDIPPMYCLEGYSLPFCKCTQTRNVRSMHLTECMVICSSVH